MAVTTVSPTNFLESFLTVQRGDEVQKSLRRAFWAGAGAVAVAATVIVSPSSATAAAACAPTWASTSVYTQGNVASQNGHNYSAKWWTQNESPATHSGQWDVWADGGACGGTHSTP